MCVTMVTLPWYYRGVTLLSLLNSFLPPISSVLLSFSLFSSFFSSTSFPPSFYSIELPLVSIQLLCSFSFIQSHCFSSPPLSPPPLPSFHSIQFPSHSVSSLLLPPHLTLCSLSSRILPVPFFLSFHSIFCGQPLSPLSSFSKLQCRAFSLPFSVPFPVPSALYFVYSPPYSFN